MLGGIIGAATGLVGGVLGGISKNRHLKEQIKARENQMANIDLWRDQEANVDPTQFAAAQRMITENARQASRAARAARAREAMGFAPESADVKMANAAKTGSMLADVAISGQSRVDSINKEARDDKKALQNEINELSAQKQNALDIANGAVGGAASGFEKGMGLQGLLKG